MLKIVVFDSGYGGEIFADKLEQEVPVVNVIRVIDWRNADDFLKNPYRAKCRAAESLAPYIGRVDLIILANYLLATTSLSFFQRKYKNQKFCGLKLPRPNNNLNNNLARPTVLLTTKALAKTLNYRSYLLHLNRKIKTICLDEWTQLIDDGEFEEVLVRNKFEALSAKSNYKPGEVIIGCNQFNDIAPELKHVISGNLKIHNGFDETIADVCKILKIRGGTGKKRK